MLPSAIVVNALYAGSVRRVGETSFIVLSVCLFFFDLAALLVALLRQAHTDTLFWLLLCTLFCAGTAGLSRYERLRDELAASWHTRETERAVTQCGLAHSDAERIVALWGVSPYRVLRTALKRRQQALGRPLTLEEVTETQALILGEYRDDALRVDIY